MIIVDTGPLYALIDKGQEETHRKCLSTAKAAKSRLITTWPCLTEAMYLLGDRCGWNGQQGLWRYLEKGLLVLHSPADNEWNRCHELMKQYNDTPMSLADASLVVLAEVTGLRRIFTLDSDFRVYRINGKDYFDIISIG